MRIHPRGPVAATVTILAGVLTTTGTAIAASPSSAEPPGPGSVDATAAPAGPGTRTSVIERAAAGSGSTTVNAARSAARKAALRLPAPSGPYAVGHASVEVVDRHRRDPWVPDAGARRLMVSLWYPARPGQGAPARYMTTRESVLMLRAQHVTGVPSDALSRVRTGVREGAAPAGRAHRLPLVVLSPGFSLNRATLTSLGADLAGRGYVTAAIDHTYETFGTTFPDGHTTTCVPCEGKQTPELARKIVRGRAADVSYVLDRLIGAHPAWRGGALIDRSRIGMAGHSIGGDATSAAMRADRRIRAGVNLDGTINTPLPASGLHRPFLLMGSQDAHRPDADDATWPKNWTRLTGWKRWITVAGAGHSSFTDLHPLADQLGLDTGTKIRGERASRITRTYVSAFFDHTLRHRHRPVLDGTSPRYPEVRFWR